MNMKPEILKKLHKYEIEILDEIVRICKKHNLRYLLYGGSMLGAARHNGYIPWDDDLDIAMPRKDYEKFMEIAKDELNEKFILDNYRTNKKYYLNFTKIRNKDTIFEEECQRDYTGPKGIWVDIFPLDNAKKAESLSQTLRVKIVKILRLIALYKNKIILGNHKKIKAVFGKCFFFISTNRIVKMQDYIMRQNKDESSKYYISMASQYDFKKQTMEKSVFEPYTQLEFEGKKYNVPGKYKYFLERIYKDYMQLPPVEKRITHNPIKLVFDNEGEIYEK